jgi:hypothetical protein
MRAGSEHVPVTTGHADGLITLDIAEAEPVHREELRISLGEPYRTPLGHVRHELGHWWWQTAIGDRFDTASFRDLFGDERADYSAALAAHYGTSDDGSWTNTHVWYYAASHPWEDFAESFAHVLHMFDTLETARSLAVLPSAAEPVSFADAYAQWVDLTATMNELNRSMGTPDPYPFAVPPPAIDKFAFVQASFAAPTD